MQIEAQALRQRMKDARYKILVACRPLAPAKAAFNIALQGIVDAVKASGDDSTAVEAIQKELELNDL